MSNNINHKRSKSSSDPYRYVSQSKIKTVLFRIISIVRVLPLRHNVVTRQSHDDELQCSLLSGKLDHPSTILVEGDH